MTAVPATRPAVEPDEQTAARQIRVIWALMVITVLGGLDSSLILPIPRFVGLAVTMGALVAAFLLALRLNPMVRVRFNAYLVLLTALTVLAFVTSYRLDSGLGSLVRCCKLAAFVAVLWLLSHWWHGDLRFVRLHIRLLGILLATVVLGVFIAPGAAFSGGGGGRLTGLIWPVQPTQVGQYAAVAAGLVMVLWMSYELENRTALLVALPAVACLVLSHTRTAIAGFAVGLAVATLPLLSTSARARRVFGRVLLLAVVAALAIPDLLLTWYQRDQAADDLAALSGRQKVWNALLAHERSPTQELIGVGLTDKSFAGLPIDSTWLANYNELGNVGVALVAAMLLALLVAAARRPPSVARRCAVFLIVYCVAASYTEVGLGDSSPYLLHLAVAASLLLPPDASNSHDTRR